MRVRDLVYLVYVENDAYFGLVGRKPSSVKVDAAQERWRHTSGHDQEWRQIGEDVFWPYGWGYTRPGLVFGVFDRTKLKHLRAMLRAVDEVPGHPVG